MIEADIFRTCLERIKDLPAVKAVKEKKKETQKGSFVYDTILEIGTVWGPAQVIAEIKNKLTKPTIQHLLFIRKNNNIPVVLFTEYVNAAIAEELKKNQINFVDCHGNAFLHLPDRIYVDVQGKKPDKITGKTQTALFQPKGMQLLFVLLTQENAVNEPIRILKLKAGIAFERAATAMKELKEKGFVFEAKDKQLRWLKKKDLLEKWLANYGDRLRPKLVIGTYKIKPSLQAHVEDTLKTGMRDATRAYAFGGGLGADLLIKYYRGPNIEIFVDPAYADRVKETLNLIPAKETNVTLLNLFTPEILFEDQNGPPVVHPLLIYAELLCQGGDRERDTAGMIFNQYLKTVFNGA